MSPRTLLDSAHAHIVRRILISKFPENKAWIFGSRARQSAKPHSDLDIVLIDPPAITEDVLAILKLEFEESDLPFRVDVAVWSQLPPLFQQEITAHHIEFT